MVVMPDKLTQERLEEIAKDFHDAYEELSSKHGWQSQKKCRVAFDDLPPANRSLMIAVVGRVCGPLVVRLAALQREVEQFKLRIPGSYPCQRCGCRDGLDAVVPDEVWARISGRTDGGGFLCLWCMDETAYRLGMPGEVTLHFAGQALYGTTPSRSEALQREVEGAYERAAKTAEGGGCVAPLGSAGPCGECLACRIAVSIRNLSALDAQETPHAT